MKIALVNVYPGGNIGDNATIMAAIDLLRAAYPDAAISLHTRSNVRGVQSHPEAFPARQGKQLFPGLLPTYELNSKQRHISFVVQAIYCLRYSILLLLCRLLGLKAGFILRNRLEREALKDIASADLVIQTGFVFSNSNMQGDLRSAINLFTVLYPSFLVGIFRRRMVMLGISIGPLSGRLTKWVTRRIFKSVSRIFVRESVGYKYLVDAGVDEKKIAVIPDLAFSLKEEEHSTIKHELTDSEGCARIAVALSRPPLSVEPGRYYQHIAALLDYIIETKNARIFMVSHSKDTADQSDTVMEIPKLLQMIKRKDRLTVLPYSSSPYYLKAIYPAMDLVIAARIHSIVLSHPTPLVVLPTVKIYRFLEVLKVLGLSDYCVDDVFNLDKMKRVVDQAWAERSHIRSHREQVMREMSKEFEQLVEELKAIAQR